MGKSYEGYWKDYKNEIGGHLKIKRGKRKNHQRATKS